MGQRGKNRKYFELKKNKNKTSKCVGYNQYNAQREREREREMNSSSKYSY
jgi:hypothetical protein